MNDKFKLNFDSDEDTFEDKLGSTKPAFFDISDDDDDEDDEDYNEKRKKIISNKFNVFGDDNSTPKKAVSEKTSQSATTVPKISFNGHKLESNPVTSSKINNENTSNKSDLFSTEIILSNYQKGLNLL